MVLKTPRLDRTDNSEQEMDNTFGSDVPNEERRRSPRIEFHNRKKTASHNMQEVIEENEALSVKKINNSSEADNEDSLYSTTSVVSSVVKISRVTKAEMSKGFKSKDPSPKRKHLKTNESMVVRNESDACERMVCGETGDLPTLTPQPFACMHNNRTAATAATYHHCHPCTLRLPSECGCANSVCSTVPINLKSGRTTWSVQDEVSPRCSTTPRASEHIERRSRLANWFQSRRYSQHEMYRQQQLIATQHEQLYKMDIASPRDEHSPPRRFIFDLVEESACNRNVNNKRVRNVPEHDVRSFYSSKNKRLDLNAPPPAPIRPAPMHETSKDKSLLTADQKSFGKQGIHGHYINGAFNFLTGGKNLKYKTLTDSLQYDSEPLIADFGIPNEQVQRSAPKPRRHSKSPKKEPERMDVYYFDHGNSAYYRTTDSPPYIMTEILAEKTDHYATKFWAQIFGSIHIGFAFITSFILQFIRFILYSIVRPLTIGIIQLVADYFFKPLLAATFNGMIQPPLILLYNIFTSFRDICEPIAKGMGFFVREIALLCSSIRLVEINKNNRGTASVATQSNI